MSARKRIAVIGAGLGGAAAAALLQQRGCDVQVYDQAPSFGRLGAGIHLGPNVIKVLDRVGIADELCRTGVEPERWLSRAWDSGDTLFSLPLKGLSEERYGARYLTVHRGDFHALLIQALAADSLHYGKKLTGLRQSSDQATMTFADGSTAEADLVIGADGLNSVVREALLGKEAPVYTGVVGHRVMIPAERLGGEKIADFTKWWANDRHFIVYYITHSRDVVYVVTGAPQPVWDSPASWVPCSKEEFRSVFTGFHPEVQKLIDLSPADGITKWAFFERQPLPLWSQGRVVLLGDACHPMKPHMGQGAAMAIEDAAMLVRCLDDIGLDDHRAAFELYELNRKDRASRVQSESHHNTWLRTDGDPSWVFGYDPYAEPLVRPALAAAGT